MLREALTASALHHPGIVTLFDLGEADGRTFLVMELVEGRVFTDLARDGLPWRRALELTAGLWSALVKARLDPPAPPRTLRVDLNGRVIP